MQLKQYKVVFHVHGWVVRRYFLKIYESCGKIDGQINIMALRFLFFFFLYQVTIFSLSAQVKNYKAIRLTGEQPRIDGRFDDRAWSDRDWESGFTQYEPVEGAQPSQRTAFKLFYDNKHIYVAIKCFDTNPQKIEKRMTRRDGFDGDFCGVHLDSYNDKRTAFVFNVSASGVKNDGIMTQDGDDYDDSLDPIWFVKTRFVDDGWQAEMMIPLSQLRFGKGEELTWGFQVVRQIFRNDEFILWKPIQRNKAGWISQYGELTGLKQLKATRQIEIAPFVVGKMERYEEEEGNPFTDGQDYGLDLGLNAKMALTNDIILDLAINPDFGQVEADPSELNLTAFETYFQEKRPFFIEGTSITNYQITPGGNPWSSDNLLYSRRIGRQPQYYPDLPDNEYINFPGHSRILGAAKITGKTKNGWSLGIIESLVDKEIAVIDQNGKQRSLEVEPLTNYAVARIQKDINKGQTIVGGMLTSTNRFTEAEELSFLPTSAYTGGIDIIQFFKEKKYFVSTTLIGSYLTGSKEAIEDVQLSSRRYYQRPDADYVTFDPERTKLSGHGGTLMFGKSALSGFRFLFNLTWRSPGLELNDIGYLRRADNVFQFLWAGYEWITPFKGIRRWQLNANQWAGWDFGGTTEFKGGNLNTSINFDNFWFFFGNYSYDFAGIDNAELRGGPALRYPANHNLNLGFGTNTTKKLKLELSYNFALSEHEHSKSHNVSGEIGYRPLSTLSFQINPVYNNRYANLQYVDEYWVDESPLYLFSKIHQKLLSFVLRIDFNISPDLTIQYYGSPFITAGFYDGFKKITDPAANEYLNRYFEFPESRIVHTVDQIHDENFYGIDNSGNGIPDFYFDNPDFNFREFRSNLVLRWEYIPGSVLFLVWTQGRTDFQVDGDFNYRQDLKELFSVTPHDVFLVKVSHRFITSY